MPESIPATERPIPADWLTAAAEAANTIFSRALKLMAPNRVFVDEVVAAVAAVLLDKLDTRDRRIAAAADQASRLNEPMLTRLAACALSGEPSDIYPGEAAELVELVRLLTTDPDPDDDEPAPLATRHRYLRIALADAVITAGLALPAEDRVWTIRDRAIAALAADLP